MATRANTPYKENGEASCWHRVLGICCICSDEDCVEALDGSIPMFIEGTFKYGEPDPVPVAMFDWKYPGKSLSDKYVAIRLQRGTANQLKIPFFFAITYLDDNFPIKCYYVIPINQFAKDKFALWTYPIEGKFLSIKQFSKIQHTLRKKIWDGDEVIEPANLLAVGLTPPMCLKDLPDQTYPYTLPIMDFE